jgi:hypothetical protein
VFGSLRSLRCRGFRVSLGLMQSRWLAGSFRYLVFVQAVAIAATWRWSVPQQPPMT